MPIGIHRARVAAMAACVAHARKTAPTRALAIRIA